MHRLKSLAVVTALMSAIALQSAGPAHADATSDALPGSYAKAYSSTSTLSIPLVATRPILDPEPAGCKYTLNIKSIANKPNFSFSMYQRAEAWVSYSGCTNKDFWSVTVRAQIQDSGTAGTNCCVAQSDKEEGQHQLVFGHAVAQQTIGLSPTLNFLIGEQVQAQYEFDIRSAANPDVEIQTCGLFTAIYPLDFEGGVVPCSVLTGES